MNASPAGGPAFRLAMEYMEIFFSGRDLERLGHVLGEDLDFDGPFHRFRSAREYVDSLIADPPVDCGYEILEAYERGASVTLVYEFSKPGVRTPMAQTFTVRDGRIARTRLIFDTGAFRRARVEARDRRLASRSLAETGARNVIRGIHAMFYASEAGALRAFIRDKLELDWTDVGEGWLIFRTSEVELGCHPEVSGMSGKDRPAGTHTISFYCDDLAATMARLRSKGVEFVGDVVEADYGITTRFRMPGGVVAELYEPRYETGFE